MNTNVKLFLIFTTMWVGVLCGEEVKDFGSQSTVIETNRLPTSGDGRINYNVMPVIGNGHIATTIYSDTIHMNGVYNGQLSESHRARIPAMINVRVKFHGEQHRNVYRQYKLDMRNGYWEENVTVAECRVSHRVYAHQFYTRLLVVEVFARRQGTATGNLMIYLNPNHGENSSDILVEEKGSFTGGNWRSRGRTKNSEVPEGHESKVYTFWSTVPPSIHIPSHKDSISYTFLMSVDTNEEIAKESFVSGSWLADNNPGHFFSLHTDAWNQKWLDGGIHLSGDAYLEKLTYSSFYYLLSSLPAADSNRELNDYGGFSPGGLANGGPDEKDRGHVSWDQERWIYPAILPFYPNIAKSLLNYRINTMPAASVQAEEQGYKGLLYSWRSAATGTDVTPQHEPRNHVHLNGDIALAMRQYTSVVRDRQWLRKNGGCDLIKELAKFWYSKLTWNDHTHQYDITDVTTVDGTQGGVDNSVYTNAVASLSLHYSKYAACLCNIDVSEYAPQEWLYAAQNIHWEFDAVKNYNPGYQGYDSKGAGEAVKQSEAILLGYPLMWKLSPSTIMENLHHYTKVMPLTTSSTAWSMLSINWLGLGKLKQAQKSFETSYKSYVTEPFKTWLKYPNTAGSNYHSAMGAYLQTLLYGYGGLRIHLEHLYMNPQLPSNVHTMVFHNIDYLGSTFDVKVQTASIQISVHTIGIYPLKLVPANSTAETHHMIRGASILLDRGAFTIVTDAQTECPLPEDNISPTSTKYKPSPQIRVDSSARQTEAHYALFLVTILCCIRELSPLHLFST